MISVISSAWRGRVSGNGAWRGCADMRVISSAWRGCVISPSPCTW